MTTRFLCFPGGKRKALTFSYDDGVEQDIRLANIFRSHNMKATFNLNSGYFGSDDGVKKPGERHRKLSVKEALTVYTPDLFEVASHCVTHAYLSATDIACGAMEVLEDRKNLETLFQTQVHGFAYPNGIYSDSIVNMLKCTGIYYARTTVSTENFVLPQDWLRLPATCHHKNPRLMELADRFLTTKVPYQPQVFYVWGHSYEFDDHDNWKIIEDFTEKMANKDDIWYATNIEIYNACLDYSRLESSADGSVIFNPSVRSVWIRDKKANVYEIKPGETIKIP
ncbi:MAG: polysaccharide deacetylase family protein [Oscillospiraceae bacterium]|nr:polysaccharide deacetylase family protein [Oscillospiraceae bacterium]